MKNSKEIASTVFQVRDEYMEHQEVKNRKIRKAAAVSGMACALCLTVVGGRDARRDRKKGLSKEWFL